MRIPLPQETCRRISDRAVQYAREDIASRGWSSRTMGSLSPMSDEGLVGIRTSVKHLMFQNQGVNPFLMTWVENKTIPIGCKQGDGPHFRRGSNVGKPGYVDIPHRGRVWRDQKWRYPGLKPKLFMQESISKAISFEKPTIQQDLMRILSGGQNG